MVAQEQKFKIKIFNGCISIKQIALENTDEIVISVYDYEDKNELYPLLIFKVNSSDNNYITKCIDIDGKYKVKVEVKCIDDCQIHKYYHNTYYYEFRFNRYLRDIVIKEFNRILCSCRDCDVNFSYCDKCKDLDRCNNYLFLLTYMFYHFNLTLGDEFRKYLDWFSFVLDDKYKKTTNDFKKLFAKGYVVGNFEYNYNYYYLLFVILYVYTVMTEIFNNDEEFQLKNIDNNCILTEYKYKKVRDCIINHGVDISKYERLFINYYYRGDILTYRESCHSINECDIIRTKINDFRYNRADFMNGIWFNITDVNSWILIVIPKLWGLPDMIIDENNNFVLEDFDTFSFSNYYVLKSKQQFNENKFFIKFIYNEYKD